MEMEEIIIKSAAELAALIRGKDVSSSEVVLAFLERIDAVNPALNAVIQIARDQAIRQAAVADKAIADGSPVGQLHGVPMTIKDSLDTAGVVTSWGTPGRAGFTPSEDATVVARMRKAGAILIGKTNTPEFTLSFETDNPVYGRTNHPLYPDRTPGGSSGGAAAILSVNGSPMDLGSDTGGSIRLPCHFCGIVGIKPTSGRVPRTGHAIPFGTLLDGFTQIGPMARYVEDLKLILPIIAGADGRDPAVVAAPMGNPDSIVLTELKGVFFSDNGIQAPTAEIAQAVFTAAKHLSSSGIDMVEGRPSVLENAFDIYNELFAAQASSTVSRLLRHAGTSETESSLSGLLKISDTTGTVLAGLIDRWDAFRLEMLRFMSEFDFMMSPVNAYPAVRHGESRSKMPGYSYTMTHNLTGWPAAVVNVGATPQGLPIGIQIAAHPWREDVVLAICQHIEMSSAIAASG